VTERWVGRSQDGGFGWSTHLGVFCFFLAGLEDDQVECNGSPPRDLALVNTSWDLFAFF